jgi:L-ascorbate 6-phosphate lactonase
VAVFFLGQAGFLFKTPSGKLVALDPYLSNCCERYFGFKRLMGKILKPDDLVIDYLLVSHAHYDHFDPDSVPVIMENGKTELIGAKDVLVECERLSINKNVTTMKVDDIIFRDDIKITAVKCDHGELAPDALGLVIEIEGKKIYFMGDTAYRPDLLENDFIKNVDLLLLPINGAFGNLNETEASKVIKALNPKLAVPCHYWNFAEHGGNPGLFQQEMKEIAPDNAYILMYQGEKLILK